jgi:hypothetical protein
MDMNKTWVKWTIIGTIIGFIISSINYLLQGLCKENYSVFCNVSNFVRFIAYFPIAYIFLSNVISFVNENIITGIFFFIVPMLQYSLIGSMIGILLNELKEHKKRR